MSRFDEPAAQAEYERLLQDGAEEGDAYYSVETRRLQGAFIPDEERHAPSMIPGVLGSSDKKRTARKRAMQQLADNDPDHYDQLVRTAKRANVDTTGKLYDDGLASYIGDPDAWVRDDSEARDIAKAKGNIVIKDGGRQKVLVPVKMDGTRPQDQIKAKPRVQGPAVAPAKRRPLSAIRKLNGQNW
jgi:hypothetical protein